MKERILKALSERDKIQKEILELIGYGSGDNSWIEWNDDEKWSMYKDDLYFIEDDYKDDVEEALENGNYYRYTISSYSSKGEKLFMKELEDITIIMAYPEEESYDNTTIYILNNKNKVE